MPYVGTGQSRNRGQIDLGLATSLCDNPSVAAQLCAFAMSAPLHGFYFQFGANKANSSYMFALKNADPEKNIIFYASEYSEFVSEFAETLLIVAEKYPNMAKTIQFLNVALKGTLKDVWDAEHTVAIEDKPLTK